MPLNTHDEDSIIRQAQSYVRGELPELDPSTEKANFISGLVIGLAKTLNHWYLALIDFANRQVHPQTATGRFLTNGWWTDLTGLQRSPITAAQGKVIAIGTAGAIIPLGTKLVSGSLEYMTLASATVLNQTIGASSLTYSNGKAIFETAVAHGLATGQVKTIAGAEDEAFNGDFEITVTATNEFTYAPLTEPEEVAGLDATASSAYASMTVRAETAGQEGNIDGGQILFETAIDDVDTTALVTFGGIAGGTDLENIEDFRERLLEALGSTLGMFTGEEIRDYVKNIPGVTRVWVRKAQLSPDTGWPGEGQAKIIFMRDNDANPIPSATEVAAVKAALVADLMPTHMVESNLIVIGPTSASIDVHFSSLTPDTASMRLAVTAQLQQFFKENISLGADVPLVPHKNLSLMDIQCAVKDTVDMETGERLQAFTITTPADDVALDPDEIPLLGQVIFNS